MICSKCKWDNVKGSLFCNKCGDNLGQNASNNDEIGNFDKGINKMLGKRTYIIVGLLIIFVAAIIVQVFYFSNKQEISFPNNFRINADMAKRLSNDEQVLVINYLEEITKCYNDRKNSIDGIINESEELKILEDQLISLARTRATDKSDALHECFILLEKTALVKSNAKIYISSYSSDYIEGEDNIVQATDEEAAPLGQAIKNAIEQYLQ